MVSIVNAVCLVSCLCLLDGRWEGIRSSYLWTWGVTSGESNYVYTCIIVCFFWFVVSLCQVVRGYALVWPVIRGVTLSDYGMATGFGPFNLPTCGPLPKGRDHSHVDSGKHIYVCIVYCCGCFFFCHLLLFLVHITSLELRCGYKF